jgi:hypothetical protein
MLTLRQYQLFPSVFEKVPRLSEAYLQRPQPSAKFTRDPLTALQRGWCDSCCLPDLLEEDVMMR